jgi:hypothetical protein
VKRRRRTTGISSDARDQHEHGGNRQQRDDRDDLRDAGDDEHRADAGRPCNAGTAR